MPVTTFLHQIEALLKAEKATEHSYLRETRRIMGEIDSIIPAWPLT